MPKLIAIGSVALLAMAFTGTAGASPVVQSTLVSQDPAGFTPRVSTGTAVYKMLQVGRTMYAGGDFTQIQNFNHSLTFNRNNLFAFDAATGAVSTTFSVTFDKPSVWGLASDGSSLWVGGDFKTVNGVARRGLAKLDLTTGAVDPNFNAHLNGNVADVQLVGVGLNRRLIVGGKFTKKLQAVNPATGADTNFLNLNITGTTAANAGATDVYRFAVDSVTTPTRLVAIGNFTAVGGVTRYRAFMADLTTIVNNMPSATLASWYYTPLSRACRAASLPQQLRDVDFSPDGSFFVIVATGYIPQPGDQGITICDATARFNTNVSNPALPAWINYTGGDTLHSVVVTDAAVYIQGHMRWINSSGIGCTPGCLVRSGIAAINKDTGLGVTTWNPGKSRGVGGKDLLLTDPFLIDPPTGTMAPGGLWVASDTNLIGNPQETHEKLAFLPLVP